MVLDTSDLASESTFWAGILGGTVEAEEDWHAVYVEGKPGLVFQLAPNHVQLDWRGRGELGEDLVDEARSLARGDRHEALPRVAGECRPDVTAWRSSRTPVSDGWSLKCTRLNQLTAMT